MIWLALVLLILGIAAITSAYKSRTSTVTNTSLSGVNIFEDFLNITQGTAYTTKLTGTGTVQQGAQLSQAVGQNFSTIMALNTNAASDVSGVSVNSGGSANAFRIVDGSASTMAAYGGFELFPAAQTYTLQIGMASSNHPSTADDAAYFIYDHSTSNFWQCVRTVNGVKTTTLTALVPDANFHTFKVIVTNSRCFYYYDAVLVATITAGGTRDSEQSPTVYMNQSAGGSGLYFDLDYIWMIHILPVPRPSP